MFRRKLVPFKTSPQIQLIRFDVVGVAFQNGGLFVSEQLHFQRGSRRQRDVVLNVEDVLQLAIVAFRPEMVTVGRVDELHGNA